MRRSLRIMKIIIFCTYIFLLFARRNPNFDKSINLFTPEGDLLQVEYAEIASGKGSTVTCLPTTDNGLVICIESDPDFDILLDKKLIDKISKIDDNIWLTFSGLGGDGRSIVRSARQYCNDYHVKYGGSPSVSAIANHLGDVQHKATFAGDQRPLGVHALICGFDEENPCPRIFSVRASGRVSAWKGYSIGRRAVKAISWLEGNFNSTKNLTDTISASINAMESSKLETDTDAKATSRYDVYHMRYGLRGKPVVSIASVAPHDDPNNIIWRRRDDINNDSKEDKEGVSSDNSRNDNAVHEKLQAAQQ